MKKPLTPPALFDLSTAFLQLKTKQEVENFLKDLCTPQENEALRDRWKVCQYLATTDLSYRDIHVLTNASLTTIGRVARFLKDEPYRGYQLLLSRLYKNLKVFQK